MRRFILYSYNFPPIGGAGAQRPVKFVRYLRELGWEAVVLTGPGHAQGRWTPQDPTLSADLPAAIEIERVPGPEPGRSQGWRGRAERWLRTPTEWERWWVAGSVEQARRFDRIDAVYTIMAPYQSSEPSRRIADEHDCPWIADLGDPWALDEMMIYPSGLHRRLELRSMRRHLNTAAGVAMSTPEAVGRVRNAFPQLRTKPVVAIPNGFDAADFESAVPARNDAKFRVVHTGYLHTELGRDQQKVSSLRRLIGGSVSGVEIITRSHVYLLEAVNRLLEEEPSVASRLEVHFAGVISQGDAEIAARCPVSHLHGYVTHAESIALMRTADLLFLPMQNLPPGQRAGIVPGKTYEYLASGRPILGALPDGDARDILEEAGGAFICRPDDVDAMQQIIRGLLCGDLSPPRRHEDVVAGFAYERLCGRVAELLAQVTG